jgi:ABC-type lipoprotein release transport system permease subunit
MTAWRYIVASLWQFRRVHLAVAVGVAVTTTVITGALLVGDSMRGSLRDLALRSLGRVDAVLMAERPFRAALAEEVLRDSNVASAYTDAVPLLVTRGAATFRHTDGNVRRAASLEVFGVPGKFWSLAPAQPQDNPQAKAPLGDGNALALTANVAAELGVGVGDDVVLRLPLAEATPADSVLGDKEEAVASRRLKVSAVLDPGGQASMARFSLRPTQQAARNAFVPLATLQSLLQLPDRASAIAFATPASDFETPRPEATLAAARRALRPELTDYGLVVDEASPGDSVGIPHDGAAASYIRISADRLVLPPHAVEVAERLYASAGLQPVVTYLANTIAVGDRKIPYSTVAAVDATAALGPVVDDAGNPIALADDEIALNDWAARELDAQVGDQVTITYYLPETTHGALEEARPVRLRLRRSSPSPTPPVNPPLPPIHDSPPSCRASRTRSRSKRGTCRSTWSKQFATRMTRTGKSGARRQKRLCPWGWAKSCGRRAGEPKAFCVCPAPTAARRLASRRSCGARSTRPKWA